MKVGEERMKIFISADIEGTTGIAHWNETEKNHPDWKYFSEQMTREVAAACQGAIDAGCEDIIVKDAHDSARNIDPRALPECVRLHRGWAGLPGSMMMCLDETFDGCVFTGYHSGASWSTSPLSHTMNLGNNYVSINGERASEMTINALMAASMGVPLLCVTGDKGICDAAKRANPNIETVAVNEGCGNGVLSIHPDVAVRRIREAVCRAIQKDKASMMFPLPEHFDVRICYKKHQSALSACQYPGVRPIDDTTVAFESDDYREVLRAFKFILSD